MWVNIGSMYKSWIQRFQEMARFVGPSTIWLKKLFQSYPELLPRIHPWHLRKWTSGSYTLYTVSSPCNVFFTSLHFKIELLWSILWFLQVKAFLLLRTDSPFLYLHYVAHHILLYNYFCSYLPSLLEYMPSSI